MTTFHTTRLAKASKCLRNGSPPRCDAPPSHALGALGPASPVPPCSSPADSSSLPALGSLQSKWSYSMRNREPVGVLMRQPMTDANIGYYGAR